jgi:hypothetical protein
VLNDRFREPRQLHALHGSDDAFETQHMIQVLWGDASDAYNQMLLTRVAAHQQGSRRGKAA